MGCWILGKTTEKRTLWVSNFIFTFYITQYYVQFSKFSSYDEILWSEYFPLDRVLDGLFELCRRLFSIRIVEMKSKVDVWHPDVKYYEIFHEDEPAIVAGFYLDLCSRYTFYINIANKFTLLFQITFYFKGHKK